MVEYFQIPSGGEFPDLSVYADFKALVIVESSVTKEWRWETSTWLVNSGCIYMMAWGEDCGEWGDSLDWAVLEKFDFGDIPDDEFVTTTWHEDIPLEEYFWESKNSFVRTYAGNEMPDNLLFHISPTNKREKFLALYEAA